VSYGGGGAVSYGGEGAVSYGGAENVTSQTLLPEDPIEYKPAQTIPQIEGSGEPYRFDSEYHGAEKNRKCTDIVMLVVFLLYICVMLGIFFYALTKSWVSYLYLPTDYNGLVCGFDNNKLEINVTNANGESIDYSNKPVLFWYIPGKKGYTKSICVESCPTEGDFVKSYINVAYKYLETNATYGLNESVYTIDGKQISATIRDPYIDNAKSYVPPYESKEILKRCFPTKITNLNDTKLAEDFEAFKNSLGSIGTSMTDIQKTWPIIIALAAIALVLAGIWILLLRYSAEFFVWFTVIAAFACLAFLTYECYAQKTATVSDLTIYTFGIIDQKTNNNAFNALFWVMVVIDTILVLIFLFMIDRIKISIGIIKVVSRVFGNVPSLFIFPLFPFVLILCWWALCIGIAVVLFGAGTFSYDPELKPYQTIGTVSFNYDSTIQYMSIIHFIGMLWGTGFIAALGEMILGGVFARYFFSREPKEENVGPSPVWNSFLTAIRYHTGSIAFGSLIVTICTILRICLEYFNEKTKDVQNSFVKFLVKCMRCCLWCFEKFIKYINRNAYVLIASHGYSFFQGSVHAFNLILRNPVRAAAVNSIGDFTLFLGKVFISALVGGISLVWFHGMSDVTFYVVPTIFVIVISFFISGAFTSLFEMGIDASFICALEDEERNDGSPGHERYADDELLEAMKATK
jgi:hypothetical protein